MAYVKAVKYTITGYGDSYEYESSYSGAAAMLLEKAIPGPSTNLEVAFALLLDGLQCLIVSADVAMTVKTNSSGAPDDTLTLVPNVPYIWMIDGGVANEITAAITSLFVTSAGSVAGTLRIEAISSATPA